MCKYYSEDGRPEGCPIRELPDWTGWVNSLEYISMTKLTRSYLMKGWGDGDIELYNNR